MAKMSKRKSLSHDRRLYVRQHLSCSSETTLEDLDDIEYYRALNMYAEHRQERVGALMSQCEEMQAFRRLYLEDIRKLREFMRSHEQCSQREWLKHFEDASAMWEKYVSIKDCLFKEMIP